MKPFVLGLALVAALRSIASAQEASTGIVANRMEPAVGPSSLVGVEGAAVTPPGALSWTFALTALGDPIRLNEATRGQLVSRPVHQVFAADAALEFGIWKRLAVAVGVPLTLYQNGDRLRGTGIDERPLSATAAGDVRVRIKGQLTSTGRRLGAAFLLQVTAPTNGNRDFAATASATIEPRLVVDGHLGPVTLALSIGVRFAEERNLFLTRFGDELTWGAGLAYALLRRERIGLSLVAEGAGAVGPSSGTRPAELRGAVRVVTRFVSIDAGGGGGLDADVGAPSWRVFAIARGLVPGL
jgi:hypothetical protein